VQSWDERIGSSPAASGVDALKALLSDVRDRAQDDVLERPSNLVAMASARLRALDVDLASEELLADVGSRLSALADAVRSHLAPEEGAEAADRGTVEAAADSLAQVVLRLPPAGDAERTELLESYRADLRQLREEISATVDEAKHELDSAVATQAKAVADRDDELATLKTSLGESNAAIEALRTEVETFLEERTTEADAAVTAARGEHEAALAKAQSEATALRTAIQEAADAAATREKELSEETRSTQQQLGEALLQEIAGLKERAEKLVGAVGRTGLSGGFQQWEAEERKAANAMRFIAIVFGTLAALAVIALLVVREAGPGDPRDVSIALAAAALAIPGAFGGVAAYAAQEAGKHRQNQVVARRTELELASFGPFIAELTDEDQQQLTSLFAPVFFGQAGSQAHAPKGGSGDLAPAPLTQAVLDRLVEVIKARLRSTPPP
jgi:hypothetical protein